MAPVSRKKQHCRDMAAKSNAVKKQKKEDQPFLLKINQIEVEVVELKRSISSCQSENCNLRNQVNLQVDEIHLIRIEIKEEKERHEATKTKLKEFQKKQVYEERNHVQEKTQLQSKIENLQLLTPKTSRGRPPKRYSDGEDRNTSERRCERVLESMRQHVGDDMDGFISKKLVNHVAKSSKYTFRTQMTVEETFLATMRFQLSDGFLKNFKSFCMESLGIRLFAPRQEVDILRKKLAPEKYYDISMVPNSKNGVDGRIIEYETALVICKDVPKALRQRLELMDLVFDEGTREDIVFTSTLDNGNGVTKYCLVLENCKTPNSAHGILLLAWYTGSDNHANLKKFLQPVFDQVNDFHEVEYLEKGVSVRRKIRQKLVGDCKLQSAVYNHKGQAALDACFECDLSWSKSGVSKALLSSFEFDQVGRIRTLDEMRAKGLEPLLNIEPIDSTPTPLHLLMRIVNKYLVEVFYAMCNQVDCKLDSLPDSLSEQEMELKIAKSEETSKKNVVDSLKRSIDIMTEMKKNYGIKHTNRISKFACSARFCSIHRLPKKLQDTQIFFCGTCSKPVHTFCAGLYTPDQQLEALELYGECLNCREGGQLPKHELIEHIQEAQVDIEQRLKKDIEELESLTKAREELENLIQKSCGPTRQELEKVLTSIGCDPKVYYMQMNGNQMRNLLKVDNIDKVLSVLEKHFDVQDLKMLMIDLSKIMSMSSNSILSDADISSLETTLKDLKCHIRLVHPYMGVLPTLHILCALLIRFVRANRTWGRSSEQGIEAFHALFNKVQKRYLSVKCPILRAKLMLQYFANLNFIFDKGASWEK